MKTALLLSGGLDSTALAFWLQPNIALTIDYGQVAYSAEFEAASSITKELEITHDVIRVDCSTIGMGDMAPSQKAGYGTKVTTTGLSDWWPFRNQLLITLAVARCITLNVREIYTGTVKTDGRFKDGTAEFYHLIDRLVAIQEGEIRLKAPAINMNSVELLRTSKIPLGLAAWSHSCHRSYIACGECRGCKKRRQVMGDMWGVR